jgi:hypothetical protein
MTRAGAISDTVLKSRGSWQQMIGLKRVIQLYDMPLNRDNGCIQTVCFHFSHRSPKKPMGV